jgi:chaperonin cofactor prefoldin
MTDRLQAEYDRKMQHLQQLETRRSAIEVEMQRLTTQMFDADVAPVSYQRRVDFQMALNRIRQRLQQDLEAIDIAVFNETHQLQQIGHALAHMQ